MRTVIIGNPPWTAVVSLFRLFFLFLWKVLFFYLIELQRTYTSTCSANSDCQTALNLICTTSSFQCNCPSHLPAYTCDCAPDKYYDYVAGCRNMIFFNSNSFIPNLPLLIPRKNLAKITMNYVLKHTIVLQTWILFVQIINAHVRKIGIGPVRSVVKLCSTNFLPKLALPLSYIFKILWKI